MDELTKRALISCSPEIASLIVGEETIDANRHDILLSAVGRGPHPVDSCRLIARYYCPALTEMDDYPSDLTGLSIVPQEDGYLALGVLDGNLYRQQLDKDFQKVGQLKLQIARKIANPFLISPDKLGCLVLDKFTLRIVPQMALGTIMDDGMVSLEDLRPPEDYVPEKRWLIIGDLAIVNSASLIELRDLRDYPGQRVVAKFTTPKDLVGIATLYLDGEAIFLFRDETAGTYHFGRLDGDMLKLGTGFTCPRTITGACWSNGLILACNDRLCRVSEETGRALLKLID